VKGVCEMISKLKQKEQLFCYYYAKLQNCKESAIKAGYGVFSAEKQGDRLLQRADIAKAIKTFQQETEYESLKQSVIAGLQRLAFANTNDSIKLILNGKEELNQLIDKLDLFHIAEIKMPKENAIEIKFFDRFKAFERLLEIVNLQDDKQTSSGFFSALESSANSLCSGEVQDGV